MRNRFFGIFVFVFASIILSVFIFPRFYVKQLLLWKLKNAWDLSYQSCHWQNKTLVLQDAAFKFKDMHCKISKGMFSPSLCWKKRIIDAFLEIENIEILTTREQTEDLSSIMDCKLFSLHLPFFSIDLHTHVKEGKFIFQKSFPFLTDFRWELWMEYKDDQQLGKNQLKLKGLGNTQEIMAWIPPKLQESFSQMFPQDRFEFDAIVQHKNDFFLLEGTVAIESQKKPQSLISFGWNFGQQISKQDTSAWIKGKQLPLEKFLTPFLLKDVNMDLNGYVDIEAFLEGDNVFLFYEGREITLESPHFCLKTYASLGEEKAQKGFHQFNIKTGSHKGYLPLSKFSYLQKKNQLFFPNAEGIIEFENHRIDLQRVQTSWKNLVLQGDVNIDIRSMNDIDLSLFIHQVQGPISTAKEFLSYIYPAPCWEFPMQGEIQTDENDIVFQYHFNPKGELKVGKILGKCHVSLPLKEWAGIPFFEVTDTDLLFSFDAIKKEVNFCRGKGWLKRGDQILIPLEINYLQIYNFPVFDLTLDVFLKDETTELAHLYIQTEKFEDGKKIFLDKTQSHIGEGVPHFECYLKDIHKIDQLTFSITTSLPHFIHDFFPYQNVISNSLLEHIPLKGDVCLQLDYQKEQLDFELSANELLISLQKEKGKNFYGKGKIKGFTFEKIEGNFQKDKSNLTFTAQRDFLPESSLSMDLEWATLEKNQRTLSLNSFLGEKNDHLEIFFNPDMKGNLRLQKIEGAFLGLNISFEEKELHPSHTISLMGALKLTSAQFFDWLPKSVREVFYNAKIGIGYELQGNFTLDKNFDWAFSGKLLGEEFELGAMVLSSLQGDIFCKEHSIEIQNLEIKDKGGFLTMDRLSIDKKRGKWGFWIPKIKITRFQPGNLRSSWIDQKKGKNNFYSFILQSFELYHFQGMFGNLKSFQGDGMILFSNYPKRGNAFNILRIPTELIACVGLDFALFKPVHGKIWYKIFNEKIHLISCEEMYSDRQRSRFFLSPTTSSFIDLHGNLNINLKMKQYTLLMKFIELLTMHVSGTVSKPSYHFISPKTKRETSSSFENP